MTRAPFPRVAAVLVLAVGPALLAAPSASARASAPLAGGEQITSYHVTLAVSADNSMRVREQITYDFGPSSGRHGIERVIPTEFPYNDNDHRVYPLDDVHASSPDGAPADVAISAGSTTVIRIGDPNRTVSGTHTYDLTYRVRGVVNTFPDHDELYWNAIGDQWSVPIAQATATVTGPSAVTKTACFVGAQASTDPCPQAGVEAGAASFATSGLQPGEGMTVVAAFPVGTFPGAAPLLKEIWTPAKAFSATPATVGAGIAVLALIAGAAGYEVSRRGRDERYLGLTPGLEPAAGQPSTTGRVGALRRGPVAVQFAPPKGMRPGQLGTLIDEQANVVDVTASIIDLAVRGWLRIEEVQHPGLLHKGDWKLVQTQPPSGGEPLLGYEQRLYNGLFSGRAEVLLSEVRQTFSSDLSAVQSMLYEDVTRQGWFRGNPARVRARWLALGLVVTLAGIGATFLLARSTHLGLLGVGVVLGGLVLLALAHRMPARTARGTAMLAQARGFQQYLTTAEANQIRYEEGEDIFSRYLPFAIVFGVADRWAKVFAQLAASGAAVTTPTWYVGQAYAYGAFDYGAFGSAVDSFATTTSGSIAAPTPSSSGTSGFGGGGFSGGGGGGGGGGSW